MSSLYGRSTTRNRLELRPRTERTNSVNYPVSIFCDAYGVPESVSEMPASLSEKEGSMILDILTPKQFRFGPRYISSLTVEGKRTDGPGVGNAVIRQGSHVESSNLSSARPRLIRFQVDVGIGSNARDKVVRILLGHPQCSGDMSGVVHTKYRSWFCQPQSKAKVDECALTHISTASCCMRWRCWAHSPISMLGRKSCSRKIVQEYKPYFSYLTHLATILLPCGVKSIPWFKEASSMTKVLLVTQPSSLRV